MCCTGFLFLWIILTFFLLFFIYDPKAPFLQQFVATLIVTGLTALPAYFSSKVLVPRLLYHKMIGKFIGALLLAALVNTVLTYFIAGALYYELSGNSVFRGNAFIQYLFSFFFIMNCIVIAVSSAVQIIIDRFGMEQQLHEVEKIIMADVIYIEAMANYVIIHTRQKKYITYLTFSGMEEQLPAQLFVRIHKSYLVAISAIQTIDGNEVITGSMSLPLSKNYRNDVMSRIEARLIKR